MIVCVQKSTISRKIESKLAKALKELKASEELRKKAQVKVISFIAVSRLLLNTYNSYTSSLMHNLQIALQDEKLTRFEKRSSMLRQKEERFSTMLSERDSLKDDLHQQKMQYLLLEQSNKELQARVSVLEEEVRRAKSHVIERELEAQEHMTTLDQYKTKITKLNNTVCNLDPLRRTLLDFLFCCF